MNGSVEEAKLQREQNPSVLIGFVKSIQYYITRKGQDSSVGIATRYRLNDLDMKSRFLRFSARVQTDRGAHPAPITIGTTVATLTKRS
jgi:hypothetical protein